MRNFELTNIILNDEDIHGNVLTLHLGNAINSNDTDLVKYIQNYLERLSSVSDYKWNVDSERAFEILREHSLV